MAQTCSIPVSIVLDIEWLRSLEKSLFTRLRWPVKMSKPCSQLNSKVIRDKVECHIVAAIEKTCSVVAFLKVCLESKGWRNSRSLELDLRKARWMWFGIVETERGLLFLFGNKHLKAWQQKEKIKNIRWRTRNRRVERRICHKSFANFNAWKASFPSNFVLGGLPNSKWFSC